MMADLLHRTAARGDEYLQQSYKIVVLIGLLCEDALFGSQDHDRYQDEQLEPFAWEPSLLSS